MHVVYLLSSLPSFRTFYLLLLTKRYCSYSLFLYCFYVAYINILDVLYLFQAFDSIKEFIDYAKENDDITILAGGNCDKRLNNDLCFLL